MSDVIPFKKPTRPQDLVLRFLNSVGHKRDADFYLNLFTSTNPESFAIIVLEEEVLKDEIDAVLFEIRYLMRLSLFPVVLIRSSDDFLEKLEIASFFKKANIALNFLSDTYSNDEKIDFIRERMKNGTLPLLHLDPDLDMADELTKLAGLLRTAKIIFLRRSGGIRYLEDERLLSIVNLRFDLAELMKTKQVHETDLEFVKNCDKIVRKCDHKIYISLVSPNNLLRELFTVKGAGTLVQLGSEIKHHQSWDNIDPRSLKRLLEMSFERKVDEGFFNGDIEHFYLEENYMGAALLKDYQGMSYLSKFAVGTEARGLGIGRDLWEEITRNHKKIFWRSNSDKFITRWYMKQCDGMHKDGKWTVFWKGIEQSEITAAVSYALSQGEDFS